MNHIASFFTTNVTSPLKLLLDQIVWGNVSDVLLIFLSTFIVTNSAVHKFEVQSKQVQVIQLLLVFTCDNK